MDAARFQWWTAASKSHYSIISSLVQEYNFARVEIAQNGILGGAAADWVFGDDIQSENDSRMGELPGGQGITS